jgi:hypothetical protein
MQAWLDAAPNEIKAMPVFDTFKRAARPAAGAIC